MFIHCLFSFVTKSDHDAPLGDVHRQVLWDAQLADQELRLRRNGLVHGDTAEQTLYSQPRP